MTRYLMKNLLSATLFVALTLTAVIWLTQSLKLLELVANSDAPPLLFIKLVALSLPRFLEVILPISLVTAILFVYNKMIMDNELIVMRSCGFDQYAMARPALILAGGITAVLLVLTTYLSPMSYSAMLQLRDSVKAQYSAFLVREGVFNTFGKNMTVYVRARNENGDLTGLMIHDMRDEHKPPATITAKRGRIAMNGDIPTIIVFDGMRQQMDDDTSAITRLYFSRYTVEINSLGSEPRKRRRDANERTLPELLSPDTTILQERQNSDLFLAEAINRIASPFNTLSYTMIALTAILLGPFNRRGQNQKVMAAGVTVALAAMLSIFLANLAKKHLAADIFLVALTVVPILFGTWALHLNGEQKLMDIIRGWNARRHREGAPG
ncbi:MAG: LptF/LptG family permease [Alphaproteobacteria bacterium]